MSRSRGATRLITRSPMRISPSVIDSSPASIRSAVVLPEPDGPTSTRNSPSAPSSVSSRTAWRVILPFGRPAVLTMVVLIFMWTWNEFLLALVMVSQENLRTAPLGLAFFQGRNTTDFSLLAAGSVIVATPVVLLYVFLQRHFIRGML